MTFPNELDRPASLAILLWLFAGESTPAVELLAQSRAKEREWLLLLL